MSISDLGERLLKSLQEISPKFAQEFSPGILRSDIIESFSSLLSCELPEYFYELHEWRNGHPDEFIQPIEGVKICDFDSIEEISEYLYWEIWEDEYPEYKGLSLFPFIENDGNYFAIVTGRSYRDEAHIVNIGKAGDVILRYDSIATMLASTVRCFEENAFFMNGEGWLVEKSHVSSMILREENPYTLAESMLDFRENIDSYGFDNEIDDACYGALVNILWSSLETLRRLKPPECIELVRDALLRVQSASPSSRSLSAQYSLNRWLKSIDEI